MDLSPYPTPETQRALHALPMAGRVRALADLLQHDDWRGPEGRVPLFEAVRQHRDPGAGAEAIELLVLLPPTEVLPILPALLRFANGEENSGSGPHQARQNAATALVGHLDAQAVLPSHVAARFRSGLEHGARHAGLTDGMARAAGVMANAADPDRAAWGERLLGMSAFDQCSLDVLRTVVLNRPALYAQSAFRDRVVDVASILTTLTRTVVPHLGPLDRARLLLGVADTDPECFVTTYEQLNAAGESPLDEADLVRLAGHRDARVRLAIFTGLQHRAHTPVVPRAR